LGALPIENSIHFPFAHIAIFPSESHWWVLAKKKTMVGIKMVSNSLKKNGKIELNKDELNCK
jgi:hypothetical protein